MKSILLSIRPEWVAKILNGEKTIEIRKKFPKDYVGWVYIYCTKGTHKLWKPHNFDKYLTFTKKALDMVKGKELNGKVIARFWCDKVLLSSYSNCCYGSCLSYDEIMEYTKGKDFVGIHISKLEVFDRPRNLCEFEKEGSWKKYGDLCNKTVCNFGYSPRTGKYIGCEKARLTKAPQNYCYIESEK